MNYENVISKLYTTDINKCLYSQHDYSVLSFVLKIENNVMQSNGTNSFPLGSLVIIDPEAEAKNNDFVIVKLSKNEIVLRQLIIDGNSKYLKKLNPKYPNQIISYKKSFIFHGIVKEIFQKL